MAPQGEGPDTSWRSQVMAGSARQAVTDCTGRRLSLAWLPRLFTHISFLPPIRSVPEPSNSHPSGTIAEVLKPQSWQVPKANWVLLMVPPGSIWASLVRRVHPASLKIDTFLTHNSPPNGRYSLYLPFLITDEKSCDRDLKLQ
jgi:hypothetical protein